MGANYVHRVLSTDIESGTAECAHCGTVKIAWNSGHGRRWPVCGVARAARRDSPARHHPRPGQGGRGAHGLTRDEARTLCEGERCAICGRSEGGGVRLVVDHCHRQGHIRGVLCNSCNRGLGFFGDDPEVLTAAIRYLAS